MRSEEEIKERLKKAEIKHVKLERECEESSHPEDKFAYAVELGHLETEIKTLRWVLGEDENEC